MPRKRKANVKGAPKEPDYFSECTVCGIECEGYQDNPFIEGICQCGHKKTEHSWPEGTAEHEAMQATKADEEAKKAKAAKKQRKREEMGLDSSDSDPSDDDSDASSTEEESSLDEDDPEYYKLVKERVEYNIQTFSPPASPSEASSEEEDEVEDQRVLRTYRKLMERVGITKKHARYVPLFEKARKLGVGEASGRKYRELELLHPHDKFTKEALARPATGGRLPEKEMREHGHLQRVRLPPSPTDPRKHVQRVMADFRFLSLPQFFPIHVPVRYSCDR